MSQENDDDNGGIGSCLTVFILGFLFALLGVVIASKLDNLFLRVGQLEQQVKWLEQKK